MSEGKLNIISFNITPNHFMRNHFDPNSCNEGLENDNMELLKVSGSIGVDDPIHEVTFCRGDDVEKFRNV